MRHSQTEETQSLLRSLAIVAIGSWVGWVSSSIIHLGERVAVLWDNKPKVAQHYPSLFATPGKSDAILAAPLVVPFSFPQKEISPWKKN